MKDKLIKGSLIFDEVKLTPKLKKSLLELAKGEGIIVYSRVVKRTLNQDDVLIKNVVVGKVKKISFSKNTNTVFFYPFSDGEKHFSQNCTYQFKFYAPTGRDPNKTYLIIY